MPPDLDLVDATFETDTGNVMTSSGPVIVPSVLTNGGTLRVFVVRRLSLMGGNVLSHSDVDGVSGPAIAFVARGDIQIRGHLRIAGTAGAVKAGPCVGANGYFTENGTSAQSAGGGGGGFATPGAAGGSVGSIAGGTAGAATGEETLVPLRGGCASGGVVVATVGTLPYGVGGGGAIQLTSRTKIEIDGTIDVRGHQGTAERVGNDLNAYYGGGAGGGILLEAPEVALNAAGRLNAKGGGGGAEGAEPSADDSINPIQGNAGAGANAGSGGNGASVSIAATAGTSVGFAAYAGAGGGGGGLGRIRINVPAGAYTKASTAVEAGMLTIATIVTR